MTKAVNLLDRVMFVTLLVFIIFIPYSAAMTQTALFILIVGWLSKHYLLKSFNVPSYGLKWPLLVIGLFILITIPMSHAPALSFKKFFSRFFQQIFLMYCVTELISTPKRLYQVMAMLLWTLLVVNADIVVQYFVGHSFIFSSQLLFQRVSGPMRHPNDLGTLLVTVIPVILSLMFTARFWMPLVFKKKFLLLLTVVGWLLLVCSVMSLGFSVSRGAWVAFAISMIGYGIYLKNYRLSAGIFLILVVFFWIFCVNCINVRSDISPKARFNATKNMETNDSATIAMIQGEKTTEAKVSEAPNYSNEKVFLNFSSRDVYWKSALDILKARPFTGCGYNAYIQTLKEMKVGHEEYPHNSLLHIVAELGILGFAAYMWFFVALSFQGIKILKTLASSPELYTLGVGLSFGILAWLIHSFLDTPWESLLLNLLWWTLIGVLLSLSNIASQLSKGGSLGGSSVQKGAV